MKDSGQVEEIEAIRKRLGVTLEQLAVRAGVNAETLRKAGKYQKASHQLMQSLRNVAAAAEAVGALEESSTPFRAPQREFPDVLGYLDDQELLNKALAALADEQIPLATRAQRALVFLSELAKRERVELSSTRSAPAPLSDDPMVANAAREGSLIAMRRAREMKSAAPGKAASTSGSKSAPK